VTCIVLLTDSSLFVSPNVVLAEYRCHYNWRDRKVTDIREAVFYPTRFASPQGTLIPLTPQDSLVVHRATPPRRRGAQLSPARQLLLFEMVAPGKVSLIPHGRKGNYDELCIG
jgi:hypothetical protein